MGSLDAIGLENQGAPGGCPFRQAKRQPAPFELRDWSRVDATAPHGFRQRLDRTVYASFLYEWS